MKKKSYLYMLSKVGKNNTPKGKVHSVVFSDWRLISGHGDGFVRLWDF
jgi:hypothetical protein